MKKISIITIIDNNNFGTFLQAFALCKKVEQLGAKPELVDYCRPHMSWKYRIKSIFQTIHNPLRVLSRLLTLWQSYKIHQKDRKFIHQYLSSSYCESIEDIKRTISADVYMTGSDQAWNSIGVLSRLRSSWCSACSIRSEHRYAPISRLGKRKDKGFVKAIQSNYSKRAFIHQASFKLRA